MDPHTDGKIELDCLRIVSFLLFHRKWLFCIESRTADVHCVAHIRNTMVQMEELRWVRDESLLKKVPSSTRVNLVAATSMAHWEHSIHLKRLTTAIPRVIAAVVTLVEEEGTYTFLLPVEITKPFR